MRRNPPLSVVLCNLFAAALWLVVGADAVRRRIGWWS